MRRKPNCFQESSGAGKRSFYVRIPAWPLVFQEEETGACSALVLGTETLIEGLPAAKQDESRIKIDSSHLV